MSQAKQIREFLKWLDTCPFKHRISSQYLNPDMQGGTVCFVKFWLEETGQLTKEEQESQKLSNLLGTMQKKDTADEDERKLAEKDLQDEKL